jgi:hypothetical protein
MVPPCSTHIVAYFTAARLGSAKAGSGKPEGSHLNAPALGKLVGEPSPCDLHRVYINIAADEPATETNRGDTRRTRAAERINDEHVARTELFDELREHVDMLLVFVVNLGR